MEYAARVGRQLLLAHRDAINSAAKESEPNRDDSDVALSLRAYTASQMDAF
jgi:hypothetical protein